MQRRLRHFLDRVFSREDWLVSLTQGLLLTFAGWFATWLAEYPVAASIPFWAGIATVLFVGIGVLKAGGASGSSARPEIRGEIETVYFHPAGTAVPGMEGTSLVAVFKIRNRGASTTLDKWRLCATPPDGKEREAKRWVTSRDIDMGSQTLSKDEDIAEKTATHSIPRGGTVRGFISGNFENLAKGSLKDPGTRLTIECSDAWGRLHVITGTLEGK